MPARHGTFKDVIARLPYVRDMGFDVLYLTPIHPIGRTNRKGRNNSLVCRAGRSGQPLRHRRRRRAAMTRSIPSSARFDDFARLVEAAAEHGLEIALDFAIQCSPDHPWIKEHPEWFDWRPDGTHPLSPRTRRRNTRTSSTSHFYGDALPVAVAGVARRRPVLGRARRQDLPRRQSAHQAVPVLGVADRARSRRAIPT